MTTLALAFQIIYFSDSICTDYYNGGEENSTYTVAVQKTGTFDDSQTNYSVIPAQCDGDQYAIFANNPPEPLHSLEGSGDLDLLWFSGSNFTLPADESSCVEVDNTEGEFWDPSSGLEDNVTYYVKFGQVPDGGEDEFTERCTTESPTVSPTAPTPAPTVHPTYRHTKSHPPITKQTQHESFTFFVASAAVLGVVGGVLLLGVCGVIAK